VLKKHCAPLNSIPSPFFVAKTRHGAILPGTCGRNFSQETKFLKMPLHRDIFWVGRQWAVTGYGIQAVNQKRHGDFDIEASRIWDQALLENLHAQAWFNAEDFSKGLAVARARFPEQQRAAPLQEALTLPSPLAAGEPVKAACEPAPPPAARFDLRIDRWPAQFTSLWRVRVKR
jgi:hypothetical protein